MINDFNMAVTKGQGRDKVQSTLDAMLDYTRTHFGREEAAMREHGYADYPAHKQLHDNFIRQTNELRNRVRENDSSVIMDLGQFLTDWLIKHIMKTDTRLAAFLGDRAI